MLTGGVLIGAGHLPTGTGAGGSVGQVVQAAHSGSGGGAQLPSPGAAASTAAAGPTSDPFTPVRTMVAQGTTGGKQWQAWAALWPAGSKDQAWQQDRLIWQEQHAAGGNLPEPTEAFAREYWNADLDQVDVYVVVDGRRQPMDQVLTTADSTQPPPSADPSGVRQGAALGQQSKNGTGSAGIGLGSVSVVFLQIDPGVAKVVVARPDGSSTETPVATVGASPGGWIALARSDASKGGAIKLYDARGRLLATNTDWLR